MTRQSESTVSIEDAIRQVQQAIAGWCWDHDFEEFKAASGWTGAYAEAKWRDLHALKTALSNFDPGTLARILEPPAEEPAE
jgi:hypothetical protein